MVLIVTLPHNGSLDMVIDCTCDNDGTENLLSKCFGYGVGSLILGTDWKDLDKAIPHVLTKMMIAYVAMFGTRMKLGKPSKFQCT